MTDVGDELLDVHLEACARRGLRPATVKARRQIVTRHARALALAPAGTVTATADEVAVWYAGLELGPGARGVELSHVRSWYQWQVREDLRVDDPTVRLDPPRVPRGLPRPIGDRELERAICAADDRVRAMLCLAACAGLRASEIAGLAGEDVHAQAEPPILHVADGKGGHQRVVPLAGEVHLALELHGLPASGPVFPRRRPPAGPVSGREVSRICNAHLRRSGAAATLHQLRHWFATNVYRQSLDLRLTQELLGHRSPNTTQRYAAWTPERGASVVGALASGRFVMPEAASA